MIKMLTNAATKIAKTLSITKSSLKDETPISKSSKIASSNNNPASKSRAGMALALHAFGCHEVLNRHAKQWGGVGVRMGVREWEEGAVEGKGFGRGREGRRGGRAGGSQVIITHTYPSN